MKRRKLTPAEEIINPYIKGDIRDYLKEERATHYISVQTALCAINYALRKKKGESK